jgi:hypothetical protein
MKNSVGKKDYKIILSFYKFLRDIRENRK